jgi:hypothetical protein
MALHDEVQCGGLHPDAAGGDGNAARFIFSADVNHVGPAAVIEMCELIDDRSRLRDSLIAK